MKELSDSLRSGRWIPDEVRLVRILTYDGRPLNAYIPSVQDRIVQRALRNVLDLVLDSLVLQPWVAGFRRGRSRISALRQSDLHLAHFPWVVDIDVAQASRMAEPTAVRRWLKEYISDGTFVNLVLRSLDGMPHPLSPGSGLHPTLMNLRLHQIDRELGDLRIVRFGDNYCAFSATRDQALESAARIRRLLIANGLSANERKSRIRERPNLEDLFLIDG